MVGDLAHRTEGYYIGASVLMERVVKLGYLSIFHRVASVMAFLQVLVLEGNLPADVSVSFWKDELIVVWVHCASTVSETG